MKMKMLTKICFFVSLTGFVHVYDVPLRPLRAKVSNESNGVVYNIQYEGTDTTHVLWKERRGPLVTFDVEQTTDSVRSSSLYLPEAPGSIVGVILSENERNMNGYRFYFYDMSQESQIPGIQVDKSAEVLHFPGARLTINITATSEDPLERRFLTADFVGVVRNKTHSQIVRTPAFQSNIPLIKNEIGRVGDTVMYEVIPPDIEGILILNSLVSDEDYENRGALVAIVVVKNLPDGQEDLFDESEPVFGVSLPDKFDAGWCACTSGIRCVIKCDTLGSNVDNIELYFENMTKAYTIRQDLRHENKYMQSEFEFDDVTKGEKGRLTCRGTDGNGSTDEESCNMIVYEVAKITDVEEDYIVNEETHINTTIFRCFATGFPRPRFSFFVDIDDDPFNMVIPTEEEPVDGVYSATYSWTSDHTVTTIRCRAVAEFTADFRTYTPTQH